LFDCLLLKICLYARGQAKTAQIYQRLGNVTCKNIMRIPKQV